EETFQRRGFVRRDLRAVTVTQERMFAPEASMTPSAHIQKREHIVNYVLKERSVLPGFGLTLGYTLLYLCLIVLIPLAALFAKSATMSFEEFWETVTAPRVVASYKLTFGASFGAAVVNSV